MIEALNVNIRNAVKINSSEINSLVFKVFIEYGLPPDPDEADNDLNNIEKRMV